MAQELYIDGKPAGTLDITGLLAQTGLDNFWFRSDRSLTPLDLEAKNAATMAASNISVTRIRDTHHGIARSIAVGMRPAEVSAHTGYSPSRISQLCRDPAFKELVEFYRAKEDDIFVDVTGRFTGVALDALCEIHRRLEEEPDCLSNKELLETIKIAADRGGHAPVQKTENKTIVISAQDLVDMKSDMDLLQSGTSHEIARQCDSADSGLNTNIDSDGNIDLTIASGSGDEA